MEEVLAMRILTMMVPHRRNFLMLDRKFCVVGTQTKHIHTSILVKSPKFIVVVRSMTCLIQMEKKVLEHQVGAFETSRYVFHCFSISVFELLKCRVEYMKLIREMYTSRGRNQRFSR